MGWKWLGGVVVVLAGAGTAWALQQAAPSCVDRDGDGFGSGCPAGPDCNDRDRDVHPGQAEQCNARDDNCNGEVDEGLDCPVPALDPSPVRLPAGTFLMGASDSAADEAPVHPVATAAFELDRHEVTNGRYAQCVHAGKCSPPMLASSATRKSYFGNPEFSDYPVIMVGWSQAEAFCHWAGGRLPTEAEWERAARGDAPSLRAFPWGDQAPDCTRANLGGKDRCVGDTDRVGRRPAGQSPWGALDMAGNVWEWVQDWYDPEFYARSPSTDPTGPASGALKVMRGGCWISGADSLRVSCRKPELPNAWAPNVGFRCAYPGRR